VWMGSRFVVTKESTALPAYKRAVLDAADTDTVYTRLFDLGWPGAPHRVLRNSTITLSESAGGEDAAAVRPGEGEVIGHSAGGAPIVRYSGDEPLTDMDGEVEAMALYAGHSAGLVHDLPAAGDLVTGLMSGSRQALSNALSTLDAGAA
ncbi:MAG: nitronate monooxygenase, partial [Acidimicrobiales bacterium]